MGWITVRIEGEPLDSPGHQRLREVLSGVPGDPLAEDRPRSDFHRHIEAGEDWTQPASIGEPG